jgi:circadian clock protein KaiC
MRSIGLDLQQWVDAGLLVVESVRPTAFGFEEHLAMLHRLAESHRPDIAVLDAVAGLGRSGQRSATTSVISRDLDLLKSRGITTVMTTLTHEDHLETSQVDMSSLIDTWLLLRNQESNGERNRLMFVIKSRGSAHSNQVREFVLTDHGPELVDVYVGPHGVLTGSARVEQMAHEQAQRTTGETERDQRRSELAARAAATEAQIAALRAQLDAETAEFERLVSVSDARRESDATVRRELARNRSRNTRRTSSREEDR